MNVDTFLNHFDLLQNPFAAEEARLDPVFDRLIGSSLTHPDFSKIAGNPGKPATSVVFGEKGTGKTAIRILMAKHISRHNDENPDNKSLLVPYDELNPVLDNLMRARKQDAGKLFGTLRLADHQDAILSSAVTALVDGILGERSKHEEPVTLPATFKGIPRSQRADLAALAAIYDNPRNGDPVDRHARLMRKVKAGKSLPMGFWLLLAGIFGVGAVSLYVYRMIEESDPIWLLPSIIAAGVVGLFFLGFWAFRQLSLGRLARKIARQTPAVGRDAKSVKAMLARLKSNSLGRQPWPLDTGEDDVEADGRYQLTRHLLDAITPLGYDGMTVLVDRVDEPTLVAGDAGKMKQLVWPMFDAKFLQQDRMGIKMLLPIELRYELRKESPEFFREARLDKGNLIERLAWTGSTLYDLCVFRLQACRPEGAAAITLMDLFDESVDQPTLIDALDQMHQPRDAFKFLYAVIQAHCLSVPDDAQDFQVARTTLEAVRRSQVDRVQDLYRGLSPG